MDIKLRKNFLKTNFDHNREQFKEKILKETRHLKKEESLMKKRKEKATDNENQTNETSYDLNFGDLDLVGIQKSLKSNDFDKKLNSTIKIRKFLSKKNPIIETIIEANLIPIFISFLEDDTEPLLQFEAAWILTNIAAGSSEQTLVLVREGAVKPLIRLLENSKTQLKEQSAWALGNIAGDSSECREFLLEMGILEPLLRQMNSPNRIEFLRNLTWTLSNLSRGKSGKKIKLIKTILPVLKKFIFSEDSTILSDVCWALSYISEGSRETIQLIIDLGIVQRVVELLMHSHVNIQTPALRILGNIATGDNFQTQVIINCGVLPCLLTLLNSNHKPIKRETCWTISNITAGNSEQIQSVIDENIIPTLIYVLKNSEIDVKKEAVWAISNAASGATSKQIEYLIKKDCLIHMIELLNSSDSRIINVILDGFLNILEIGQQKVNQEFSNEYARIIEQNEGLEKLENLQHHVNNDIYKKTTHLLKNYFGAEDGLNTNDSPNKIKGNTIFSKPSQIPQCSFNFSKK